MDKLSISSVWQIKHTKNCNICKDCALEFSDLESYVSLHKIIRDRPFNLKVGVMVFCFVHKLFFGQHKSQTIFFFVGQSAIFFPEFNIRLYDKNSESDYFSFPPPKSEYFFQQHWESEYFLEQNHDYHDYAVCDLLEYGWPVGHLGLERNRKNFGNNQQRTQFVFPNVKTINAAVKTHTRQCPRS